MSALPTEPVHAPEPAASSPAVDIRDYWDGVSAFYAGSANVALQMLGAPGVAYGVMESKVESGRVDRHPFKRGRTTMTYLAVAAFGTDEDRAAYREAVNGVHRHVRSTDDSPVAYNAFHRDLQLWVAACLYFGWADTYDRLHGPLDDETADALYQQLATLGTTLQVPREMWPEDRAAFDAYFQQRIADADIDEPTAEYVRMLIGFDMTPWWFKPAGKLLAFMNTGYTPPALRAKLGLRWSGRHQLVFDRVNRLTGSVLRRLPRTIRLMPHNLYLRDLRRRVRSGRPLV